MCWCASTRVKRKPVSTLKWNRPKAWILFRQLESKWSCWIKSMRTVVFFFYIKRTVYQLRIFFSLSITKWSPNKADVSAQPTCVVRPKKNHVLLIHLTTEQCRMHANEHGSRAELAQPLQHRCSMTLLLAPPSSRRPRYRSWSKRYHACIMVEANDLVTLHLWCPNLSSFRTLGSVDEDACWSRSRPEAAHAPDPLACMESIVLVESLRVCVCDPCTQGPV
jgi:hypothetical protein